MASIGHIAVGLAVARRRQQTGALRRGLLTSALLWSGLSLAPDLDVVGFAMGVAYADPWGHRGATHSLAFAAALGALAFVLHLRNTHAASTAWWVFVVSASHGVLDMFTDGGLGVALAWPWTDARWFAPWTPIPVAPIGRHLWSSRGAYVMATEVVMFAPLLIYGLWPRRAGRPAE